jgi:glycosyltransferase involved in cell wall biosynthesis
VGGLSFDISDGFNGYLVPDGDAQALAYKIGLLLTQDTLRRQLGGQARRWAERFSWAAITDEILAIYAEAAGLAPAEPTSRQQRQANWQGFDDRSCP